MPSADACPEHLPRWIEALQPHVVDPGRPTEDMKRLGAEVGSA